MRAIKLLEDIDGAYGNVFKKGDFFKDEGPDGDTKFDGEDFIICQGMDLYFVVKKHQYEEMRYSGNNRYYPVSMLENTFKWLVAINEIEDYIEQGKDLTYIASKMHNKYKIIEK